ncbi:MAG TPA: 30S ribosomal protein S12 methylthiotransferase RimO [Bacteroidota bacterium]|nr:30S ribosomal protein S12 methylthiotransferase RimO [Bacteroidota bacterium]
MSKPSKKINIITLGCAKNQVDSEALWSQFEGNDLEVTSNISDASIAVINTCGFIEEAKKQSIDTILETVRLKNEGKLERVIVMGCLSERYHDELSKEIPEVDRFFGSKEIPAIVSELGGNYKYDLLGERVLSTPNYSAYLKISEGCDNPCSFCAIPLMRGLHRSKPVEQIMDEVMRLTAKGVKELVVIGQDTTYYGLDLYGGRKLASLLQSLASVKELEWIRLMYAYPAKFPLDILAPIRDSENICPYLDLPIQHASDDVLKSMRRGTTRRAIESLIASIRKEVPDIALRTTLITGYPSETERDFNELLDFIRTVRFDRLGVFTYSQEDGTTSFDLGDPIPQVEKEARRAKIMDLQKEISRERNEERIGKVARAVVERCENGTYIGRTQWDAPEVDNEIFITPMPGRRLAVGEFVDVKVTDAAEFDLYGEVVQEPRASEAKPSSAIAPWTK